MSSHVYFPLLIALSFITISDATTVTVIKTDLLRRFEKGASAITISKDKNLKLLNNGRLAETDHSLVWKGTYDNKPVACKIVYDQEDMDDEMKIFNALDATTNLDKEPHEIPKVFYHGPALGKYHAIAMTLFDETLLNRYEKQNCRLSFFSTLVIFKQAVEALQFLHSRKVLHNDVNPSNIFLHNSEVFFSDFHLATLNDCEKPSFSAIFGSSSFHAGRARRPMDDYESLVYSIWYIANVPMRRLIGFGIPEGRFLLSLNKEEAIARMEEKAAYLPDKSVEKAFLFANMEIVSGKHEPDYKGVIEKLSKAIAEVSQKTSQSRFEWLE